VYGTNVEMLDLILDLFGKAKKKILKQDDIPETFPNAIPQDKRRSPEINWGPQEIGIAEILASQSCFQQEIVFSLKFLNNQI